MSKRDLDLPADVHAPARARHALDEEPLPPSALERFRMAVSELVTNVVRHAGLSPSDKLVLKLRTSKQRIRVELDYPGRPIGVEPKEPDPTEESGRGLLLVDEVVNRWGTGGPQGIKMWFEIDLANGGDVAA